MSETFKDDFDIWFAAEDSVVITDGMVASFTVTYVNDLFSETHPKDEFAMGEIGIVLRFLTENRKFEYVSDFYSGKFDVELCSTICGFLSGGSKINRMKFMQWLGMRIKNKLLGRDLFHAMDACPVESSGIFKCYLTKRKVINIPAKIYKELGLKPDQLVRVSIEKSAD